jgi:hypothetical protein
MAQRDKDFILGWISGAAVVAGIFLMIIGMIT